MNPFYPLVADRAKHRCEYCMAPEVMFNFPFEVEHIHPKSQGGSDGASNFALGCRACNVFKAARTTGMDPAGNRISSLFHPRRHVWSDHFRSDSEGRLIGLTPIGRATINELRMNAEYQLRARLQWKRLGLFD